MSGYKNILSNRMKKQEEEVDDERDITINASVEFEQEHEDNSYSLEDDSMIVINSEDKIEILGCEDQTTKSVKKGLIIDSYNIIKYDIILYSIV